MEYLNTELRRLQRKVARKRQLQSLCDSLRRQRTALLDKVAVLDQIATKEEADVLRLEGRGLAAWIYHVVGIMDEKLEQERREAYAARVKYQVAARELEAVEQELFRCGQELASLALCEDHYRMCLEEKAAAIKASCSSEGLEILRLETCLQTLECQMKELNEAADAGNTALFLVKNMQSALEHTQELGTRDIFCGELPADTGTCDLLEDAQSMVERLQLQLCRFRTELADVKIDADIQLSLDGFSRFADSFLDGLFADWTLMDRVQQARNQVEQIRDQIETVLQMLDDLIRLNREEIQRSRAALDCFIAKA